MKTMHVSRSHAKLAHTTRVLLPVRLGWDTSTPYKYFEMVQAGPPMQDWCPAGGLGKFHK